MAKPYIILVHGAYHQPTHWDLLVKLLQAAGHPTSTPKLPSSSASPLAGVFDADISSVKQAVIDAIAEECFGWWDKSRRLGKFEQVEQHAWT